MKLPNNGRVLGQRRTSYYSKKKKNKGHQDGSNGGKPSTTGLMSMMLMLMFVCVTFNTSIMNSRMNTNLASLEEQGLLPSSSSLSLVDGGGDGGSRDGSSRSSSTVEEEEAEADNDNDGKLHVVISHCKLSIGWIWKKYLYNQSYESVTIISKCGVPIPPEDMPPAITLTHHQQDQNQYEYQEQNDKTLVQIISLPNVGRCDHSFAYWIAMVLGNEEKSMKDDYQLLYSNRDQNNNNNNNNIKKTNNSSSSSSSSSSNNSINPFQSITIDPKDYIIFMKDNDNEYRGFEQPIPLQNMFVEMKTNNVGMACASVLRVRARWGSMTNWAHRGVMWNRAKMYQYSADKYKKNNTIVDFQSSHRPMGEWIRYLSVYNDKSYIHNSRNNSSHYISSGDDDYDVEYHHQVFSDKYLENISRSISRNMQSIRIKRLEKYLESYNELDLVPVCFGGRFMTRWGQLSSDDAPIENWSTITKGLGRGDNIEEGHYMERWWADILSWSSYSSRLLDTTTTTTTDTTQISDDDGDAKTAAAAAATATATNTTSTTNDISGIIFKNRDHTIFYDESRPHRRPTGEVLTQNEQRNVLGEKSHLISKRRELSGMIVLRKKKKKDTGIVTGGTTNTETAMDVQQDDYFSPYSIKIDIRFDKNGTL